MKVPQVIRIATIGLAFVSAYGRLLSDNNCKYSGTGVNYDLSALKDDKALAVLGGDLLDTSVKEKTWNYTFAICRNLEGGEVPPVCKKAGTRLDAAVYQTIPKGENNNNDSSNNDDLCVPAGLWITDPVSDFPSSITVLNPNGEAAGFGFGVNLTYRGGDKCTNGEHRQFSLHVRCADAVRVKPVSVVELGKDGRPNKCHYQASVDSIAGCPTECGRGQNSEGQMSLCSGRGICGFDRGLHKARCFCDDGYQGDSCHETAVPPSEPSSNNGSSSGGTRTLTILLLLVVMLLFAIVVFLANQIKAYRIDAQNYMQIRGTEMVDQMSEF
mmetsp:Transcript_20567/g.24936  ORF Transcript_20567/g.24936 Transcript_20567/m.24936 type:complete len:327 (-) Transcript_20567:768-1748(-)|eukprot:CAMPEP_0204861548 /NCGR_PEP_ID=MMETSP1348-20121228/1695_1 /ASSEMBLY_ACC=CAM_ASM_000700 /TAXON_ID=215587 /ORGANISM="Aplanochytrium stocchinoi, Strain GSBS06" /LENGTH=326 /DNA_ID=CAMNT_0052011005 /DNA_START=259 /DNA_END=1239 /DNA_ORIENTATION=-